MKNGYETHQKGMIMVMDFALMTADTKKPNHAQSRVKMFF